MKTALTISLIAALVAVPGSAFSSDTVTPEVTIARSAPVIVKSLTDYPGTGARVADNPYRMNVAVRMRAKLVCEYAKSLRPDLSYWYQTKVTQHENFNGRVIVVSK
jgi:hypothetical protein